MATRRHVTSKFDTVLCECQPICFIALAPDA
jgi:hypothetical protein